MKERRCDKCGILKDSEYVQYSIQEGLASSVVCITCYANWWENFNKKSRIEEKYMERRIQQGETQYNLFEKVKIETKQPVYIGLINEVKNNISVVIDGIRQRDKDKLAFNFLKLEEIELDLEIALVELKKIAIGR